MGALKPKTLDDLLLEPDERVELIDGEIVRRPMARSDEDGGYRVIKTMTGESIADQPRVRIPPFDDVEVDLAYILGE